MKDIRTCYEVRLVDTQMTGQDGKPVLTHSAFAPDGGYIGRTVDAEILVIERGIQPELADPEDRVCSIGFCEKEQKWYGWSHRSRYAFGIGSTIKKGDAGYSGTTPEELIEDHANFFSDVTDDPEKSLEIVAEHRARCHIAVDRTGIFIGVGENPHFKPCGPGEWTAKTLEDARQMAKDFAEAVS